MTCSGDGVVTESADAGEQAAGDMDAGGEAGEADGLKPPASDAEVVVSVARRFISQAGGGCAKTASSGVDDETT